MLFGTGLGLLTAELPKPCALHVRAAVAVCTHQHFPVGVGCPVSWATGQVCVDSGYYLPFASSLRILLSVNQKELSTPLCFAGKAPRQGLSWVQQWGVLLGLLAARGEHSAACAGRWCYQTLHYFGKNSWGVSCQSYIRVLSYSFLAAFLLL